MTRVSVEVEVDVHDLGHEAILEAARSLGFAEHDPVIVSELAYFIATGNADEAHRSLLNLVGDCGSAREAAEIGRLRRR